MSNRVNLAEDTSNRLIKASSQVYQTENESFLKKHKRSEENNFQEATGKESSFRRKSFNPIFNSEDLEEGEIEFATPSTSLGNFNIPSSPDLKSVNSVTSNSVNMNMNNISINNGIPKKKLDLKDLLKKKKHTDSSSNSSTDKNGNSCSDSSFEKVMKQRRENKNIEYKFLETDEQSSSHLNRNESNFKGNNNWPRIENVNQQQSYNNNYNSKFNYKNQNDFSVYGQNNFTDNFPISTPSYTNFNSNNQRGSQNKNYKNQRGANNKYLSESKQEIFRDAINTYMETKKVYQQEHSEEKHEIQRKENLQQHPEKEKEPNVLVKQFEEKSPVEFEPKEKPREIISEFNIIDLQGNQTQLSEKNISNNNHMLSSAIIQDSNNYPPLKEELIYSNEFSGIIELPESDSEKDVSQIQVKHIINIGSEEDDEPLENINAMKIDEDYSFASQEKNLIQHHQEEKVNQNCQSEKFLDMNVDMNMTLSNKSKISDKSEHNENSKIDISIKKEETCYNNNISQISVENTLLDINQVNRSNRSFSSNISELSDVRMSNGSIAKKNKHDISFKKLNMYYPLDFEENIDPNDEELSQKIQEIENLMKEIKLNEEKKSTMRMRTDVIPKVKNKKEVYFNNSFLMFYLNTFALSSVAKKLNNREFKLNLVLDIDSTLLFAEHDSKLNNANPWKLEAPLITPVIGNTPYKLRLKIRKNTIDLLRRASNFCNIFIYTHGQEPYAWEVVRVLTELSGIEIKHENVIGLKYNTPPTQKSLRHFSEDPLFKSRALILDDNARAWESEWHLNLIQSMKFIGFMPSPLFDEKIYRQESTPGNSKINYPYILMHNRILDCNDYQSKLLDENNAPFSIEYDHSNKIQMPSVIELIENVYKLSVLDNSKKFIIIKYVFNLFVVIFSSY
jgi:hypothetical protein